MMNSVQTLLMKRLKFLYMETIVKDAFYLNPSIEPNFRPIIELYVSSADRNNLFFWYVFSTLTLILFTRNNIIRISYSMNECYCPPVGDGLGNVN